MEINLSNEMIRKITYVSAGRLSDLKEKEKAIKDSIWVGEAQIRRKRMQLKDIEKAKEEAKEVHTLFLGLLEEIEKEDEVEEEHYTPSSTNRDYSPSNPWDAPGMSIKDFI